MGRNLKTLALAAAAAFLAAPPSARAQEATAANFALRYDLDSTSLTYPRVMGQNGAFGGSIAGQAPIKTTGSNVAVTAVSAGSNPFASVAIDDVVVVDRGNGVTDVRVVVAKTDADTIEVDTAVDWSAGFSFRWLDTQTGTGDGDGWIKVSGFANRMITFQLEQVSGVTGGIDTRLECRGGAVGAKSTIVWPGSNATAQTCGAGTLASGFCNFTAAGIASHTAILLNLEEAWLQCRFGLKINTSDAAEAAEANKERITITFDGVGRLR